MRRKGSTGLVAVIVGSNAQSIMASLIGRQKNPAVAAAGDQSKGAMIAPTMRTDDLSQRSDFERPYFPSVIVRPQRPIELTSWHIAGFVQDRHIALSIYEPIEIASTNFAHV